MSGLMDKVCPRGALDERLASLPRPWVFTNGVFDVLHKGHVHYLHDARSLGASLIVAVNSDFSARQLGKGPERPLNKAEDRAAVLAGLASVSLVTFFDERTPVALLKEVRPDLYVKGGDYDMETLEETRAVRSWGGEAVAIPFVDGYSTTSLVQRIRAGEVPQPARKAAFLDRDGVINRDRAYVSRWEDFEFVPGAVDAMRQLQDAGYALVVITNQSGLARGYYTESQYQALTQHMRTALSTAGVELTGVYHCPHHPNGTVAGLTQNCDCRKPAPGLILRAASELNLSLTDSLLVGDKPSDIQAARAAGVGRAYLVQSDNPESLLEIESADASYSDLSSCVSALLHQSQTPCQVNAS